MEYYELTKNLYNMPKGMVFQTKDGNLISEGRNGQIYLSLVWRNTSYFKKIKRHKEKKLLYTLLIFSLPISVVIAMLLEV